MHYFGNDSARERKDLSYNDAKRKGDVELPKQTIIIGYMDNMGINATRDGSL